MLASTIHTLTKYYPFQQPRASLLARLPDVPDNASGFLAKRGIRYVAYTTGKDYIVKNLFWFGDFEPWITKVIVNLIRANEVICDIGANIGDTTLQIFSYVGASVNIYCFEPVPSLYECLKENLQANNVSCVTLVTQALSSSFGKLKMIVPTAQPGWARVAEGTESNLSQETVEVEVITFDSWLNQSNLPQIAVCKIDVEGHELEVLLGMKEALSMGRIGSIIFERYKECNEEDAVIKLLRDYRFRLFRIYKSFLKVEVIELGNEREYLRGTPDYVAVLEGSVFEERLKPFFRRTK